MMLIMLSSHKKDIKSQVQSIRSFRACTGCNALTAVRAIKEGIFTVKTAEEAANILLTVGPFVASATAFDMGEA